MKRAFLILAVMLAVVTAAVGAEDKSLYERLGGEPAITAVVDEFVARVAADNRINKFFANTNIPRLKKLLVEQIGAATGGPQKYTGRDMKSSHKGMGVTEADFNALVEDLIGALDKFNVPNREKSELLALLGPMKGDIVEGPKSLYERLGGEPAITAVVDEFVARVAADKRINKFFANTNIPRLKRMLVDQIGQASGGPQKYTGRDMKSAHKGMGLTDADFNALVEDLVGALDKFNVPEREKGELLAVLGPMRADIVERKAAGRPGSLYERLGGEAAITAVVDALLGEIAQDRRINHRFSHTDFGRLRKNLIDQLGEATGGPQRYRGKSMRDAHRGLNITIHEFEAMVDDLVTVLNKFKVPQKEQQELLRILGGMKGDIIYIK